MKTIVVINESEIGEERTLVSQSENIDNVLSENIEEAPLQRHQRVKLGIFSVEPINSCEEIVLKHEKGYFNFYTVFISFRVYVVMKRLV